MKSLFFKLFAASFLMLGFYSNLNANNHQIITNNNSNGTEAPGSGGNVGHTIGLACGGNSIAGKIVAITSNFDGTFTITLDVFGSHVDQNGATIYNTNTVVSQTTIFVACYDRVKYYSVGGIYAHCF